MEEGAAMKRRGILAAAGAVVATIVAKQTSQPVGATSGAGPDGTLVLGSNFGNSANTASRLTVVATGAGDFGYPAIVFDVEASAGGGTTPNINALYGHAKGTGAGVTGVTGGDIGANASILSNAGVAGYGLGGSYGIFGQSISSTGVYGSTTSGTGVAGYHTATSGAGQGVYAQTSSPGGFGIVGQNTAPGGTGLLGYCAVPASGAIAFAGSAGPGNYAAYFNGTVVVNGQLVVSNPSYKSGVLKHSGDGTDRLVYCMESPESWIEDFGKAQLVNGKADVKLDPDFAAVVQTDSYRVFLTPEGDSKGLFVTNKGAKGFTVQEQQGGTSSLTFSYRVVAKPKVGAGVTLKRLEKFTVPKAPTIDPASFPKASDATVLTPPTPPASTQPPSPAPAPRPAAASAPAVVPAAASPTTPATAPATKVDVPAPAPPSR